jgi:hypothetical protein
MVFELDQHIKKMECISENISSNSDASGTVITGIPCYIDNLKKTKDYKDSTTGRRAEFETLNLEKVNYVKSCLLIIYCLLVLWFVYVMFNNKELKLRQKGILICAMVAYPYIASPAIIYLYETVMYIVALMTGDIYKKAELQ